MKHLGSASWVVILVAALMVGMALVAITSGALPAGSAAGIPAGSGAPAASAGGAPPSTDASSAASTSTSSAALPSYCSQLETVNNDPGYAQFVNHVNSIAHSAAADGLSSVGEHLPYTGTIPDQTVDGVAMAGSQLSQQCQQGVQTTSQTDPTGVAYDGASDVAGTVVDQKLDSNSVAGILTVNSQTQNFYPGSGTPTQWGAQENVVLPNVTLFGSQCPKAPCATGKATGNYAFWVQNVISYDSFNDTISFVDDTWNFTNGNADMFASSLVDWSPNGGNYTGVWVAYSPYYYAPPPFTATAYVNTSVNSAGDQILWYNYSIESQGHFIGNGNYDYLVFNSQPLSGTPISLAPPDFEASAVTTHEVTEGYEFDAFIGADDGSNQLMLNENATMQVQYCVQVPYCTPTSFSYANVPAAVSYGSQTGEQTTGVGVTFSYDGPNGGAEAMLNPGPLTTHGLWNYTGQTGVAQGATPVTNAITVSGDPEGALAAQPYVFVFMEDAAYSSQGYQWVPDQPTWYLMPGTYNYELMLADYDQVNGTLVVGSSATTLTANLAYNATMGVYTPLWAFGNAELAGISSSGSGTISSQYLPFNNPSPGTYAAPASNISANFYSLDDYDFPSFPGVLFDGTSAYVDLNAPVSFAVDHTTTRGTTSTTTTYYLGFEFFETSHLTLSNAAAIRGWSEWEEIDFYISVPATQNPAPQAEVFVWNSTDDLIMSNTFVGTAATGSHVAPDALVLYGGGNNVVWGNTFRDPYHTAFGSTYAGIGLAEANDLIYNNNFSVDNPVVYLPYNWDNVADCLPQSLGGCGNNANPTTNGWYYNVLANVIGDTWNVVPQSADNVVNTVNGFALNGNVLGPSVTTQGGNYYWNLGTGPNWLTTSPYVSRFYYSDWSNIFPLGCGSIQAPGAPCGTAPAVVGAYENGIQVGGDYAPYGPTVTFTQAGLVGGTEWSVVFNGTTYEVTSASISIPIPYGTYTYSIPSLVGYSQSVSSGSVVASGVPRVNVVFSQLSYAVAFSESGLPAGAEWYVNITSGPSLAGPGATTQLSTELPDGTYYYTVATDDSQYAPNAYTGSVTVYGASVSASPITFTLQTFSVTFTESGLPGGTGWTATLGGAPMTSTGTSIAFAEPNATYAYGIASSTPTYAPSVYSGGVLVEGLPVGIPVTFSPVTFTISFAQSGLPDGAVWYVNVTGGPDLSASGAVTGLTSSLFNGTYAYTYATNDKTYAPAYTAGTLTVNGAAAAETDSFAIVTYALTFSETGLPVHTVWTVTVGAATESTSGTSLVLQEPNGTYGYAVATADGGSFPDAVTVNGAAVSIPTAFHKVTFVETGLPSGTEWQATTNAVTESSTTTKIPFYLVNGAYSYQIGIVAGYHATDVGSFSVVGTTLGVNVAFKETTYSVKFTETGFTVAWKTTWCVTLNSVTKCSTPGATSIKFTGVANGTYSYTIGTVANYTLNGNAYAGTVTISGVGQGSLAATIATHWTLLRYSVKFTESGLHSGASWQVTVNGVTKSTTGKSLSFLIPNGTYAYTASSAGVPSVVGDVTVNGATVLVAVPFT